MKQHLVRYCTANHYPICYEEFDVFKILVPNHPFPENRYREWPSRTTFVSYTSSWRKSGCILNRLI